MRALAVCLTFWLYLTQSPAAQASPRVTAANATYGATLPDSPEAEPEALEEDAGYDVVFGSDQAALSGPELAIRSGLAFGGGRLTEDQRVRDRVIAIVPIWVDLGYRDRRWFVGGYGQFGFGVASATSREDCPGCLHTPMRLGLQVQHVLYRTERMELWSGLGAGFQQLSTTTNNQVSETQSVSGWDYAMLQVGGAWKLTTGITLGPFSAFSIGSFDTLVEDCARRVCRSETETDLNNIGLVTWFTTGIRLTLLP